MCVLLLYSPFVSFLKGFFRCCSVLCFVFCVLCFVFLCFVLLWCSSYSLKKKEQRCVCDVSFVMCKFGLHFVSTPLFSCVVCCPLEVFVFVCVAVVVLFCFVVLCVYWSI